VSRSSVTIFHNPRCSKSRQTLQLIREAGVEPDVVEYLKSPPSVAELDGILTKLNLEPLHLMRRKELVFNELGLADRDLTRDEAIAIMVENPVLIERPIVVKGGNAVIGRPPENVNELLQ
jgi:arsenate reductase (glutaredoxin)